MYRFNPATRNHEVVYEGVNVGGMTLQADGSLLLFHAPAAVSVWRYGDKEPRVIVEGLPDGFEGNFNDGIADPRGGAFGGICNRKPGEKGGLYHIDVDGNISQRLVDGVGCSNGMGFSPDLKTFYYTDTVPGTITAYDYDAATGTIANPRVVVEHNLEKGGPDGMTVDTAGRIWSAIWSGYAVVVFDPDGRELHRVPTGASRTSSVTFGGPDYDELYITSAAGRGPVDDADVHPGALFHALPWLPDGTRAQGRAEFETRVGLR
jgi:D-xylonolactonase